MHHTSHWMLVLGIFLVLYGGAEAKDLLLKYIVGYPAGEIGHTAVLYLVIQDVSQGTGTEANYGTTLAEHIDGLTARKQGLGTFLATPALHSAVYP